MKESGDLSGGSKDSEDLPEGRMVHRIEGRLEIQESDVEMSILAEFLSLLNDETKGRNLVYSGAVWHEARLLGASFTSDGWKGPGEKDAGEDLSWNGKECNSSVVTADQFVTLVLPEGEDHTSGPVLWGALGYPDLVNDVGEPVDGVVTACFQHFCCDVADTRGLAIMKF